MNSQPVSNISLYIPHVFNNITEERIKYTFQVLDIGKISYIDFIPKTDLTGTEYNAVYIYFDYWYASTAAYNFQEKVLNPEKVAKLVYNDPWYWIVLHNKSAKFNFYEQQQITSNKQEMENTLEQMKECIELAWVTQLENVKARTAYVSADYVTKLEAERDMFKSDYLKQNAKIFELTQKLRRQQQVTTMVECDRDNYVMILEGVTEDLDKKDNQFKDLEQKYKLLMDEKLCLSHEVANLKEEGFEYI